MTAWSRFAHCVRVQDRYALYHSLNLSVLFVDSGIGAEIEQGLDRRELAESLALRLSGVPVDDNVTLDAELRARGFIVDGDDDQDSLQRWRSALQDLPVGILYLIISDDCNFACSYCFEKKAPGRAVGSMSADLAAQSLRLFARTLARGGQPYRAEVPEVVFYGGEPLLNFETLRFCLDMLDSMRKSGELPSGTKAIVNTNGSLITGDVARTFKEHNVMVALSLDGQEETHNANRRYRSGSGTFQDALRGLKLLQDHGVQVSVSCTLNDDNLGEVDGLVPWLAELGVKGFGFNPQIGQGVDSEYARTATAAIIRSFKNGRAQGIYEDRMMRKIKAFAEGRIYLNDCAGCGQQICVSPAGKVGPCQAFLLETDEYSVPFDSDLDCATDPIWVHWRGRSPVAMEECQSCIALGICGGGCPYSAYLNHADIFKLDDNFCVHAKMILEFMFDDLLMQQAALSAES